VHDSQAVRGRAGAEVPAVNECRPESAVRGIESDACSRYARTNDEDIEFRVGEPGDRGGGGKG